MISVTDLVEMLWSEDIEVTINPKKKDRSIEIRILAYNGTRETVIIPRKDILALQQDAAQTITADNFILDKIASGVASLRARSKLSHEGRKA